MSEATDGSAVKELTPTRRETDLPANAPWWAHWLDSNVRQCWKWASTWLTVIAAAAPLLYENISSLHGAVSDGAFHYISSALIVLIFVGRIKRQ